MPEIHKTNKSLFIEESWFDALQDEFEKPYFISLKKFLQEEKRKFHVFPPGPLIFNAFQLTPLPAVKVVIIGQDPYHGQGQAHGLSFSVPDGIPQPPSLVNIIKEIESDLKIQCSKSGNLEKWAECNINCPQWPSRFAPGQRLGNFYR